MFENGNVLKGINISACMFHSLQSQMKVISTCYVQWTFG